MNIDKLSDIIERNEKVYQSVKELIRTIAFDKNTILDGSPLFESAFKGFVFFTPKSATTNEIISTGSLQDITNDSIRYFISAWESKLALIERQEDEVKLYRQKATDLMIQKGIVGTNAIKGAFPDNHKELVNGLVERSFSELLDSKEFINTISIFMAVSKNMNQLFYEPLLRDLEETKRTIEGDVN